MSSSSSAFESQPLWYKDAVIYQVHVRAFYDKNGDGIGDFAGLTEKLDYLQDLGITAIWLQPFYPSPLKDDGYDIADYRNVNPMYGNLEDFQTFLQEAHSRGLRVITELVLNHTSDQHAWFQRARRAPPGSVERDFYVWSDAPDKYLDARIIFKDFEPSNWSYDNVAQAYYWHRFYSHQPDLNYDNPAVQQAAFEILDYWFEMGIDGLRLDAVPYLFEREGTNCENLPETHAFLKALRARIDAKFSDRMLLAEANQWPEDAIAYFGDGDECHTAFHFPLMPRLFMSVHMEDRFPIIDIMQQTPPIPDICQWMIFLRNHDELTLEMVTDEERDYMYRVYAHDRQARINLGIRRRLAPLLGNNRRKLELMNGLLMSMPGTPVIYYGDEIGMGDNIYLGDRNGVRTPMQWSDDRNAGFSRANPQKLFQPTIIDSEYHYASLNVETQRNNPGSLFWWMKRLIGIRQQYPAFGRGTQEFLSPENSKVLAFLRSYEDQTILVVANLSRFSQYVELDLRAYDGHCPVELFGQNRFPNIGQLPYLLTLGPHGIYAFLLENPSSNERQRTLAEQSADLPQISLQKSWHELLKGRGKTAFERTLRESLPTRRWFSGKARTISSVSLTESVPLADIAYEIQGVLSFITVEYTEGESDTYALPLAVSPLDQVARFANDAQQVIFARITLHDTEQVYYVYDALWEPPFAKHLLQFIAGSAQASGEHGKLHGSVSEQFAAQLTPEVAGSLNATLLRSDQSNTSVIYDDQYILKLFRRVEPGVNPDLEIGQFLTEEVHFPYTPPVAGTLEYRPANGEATSLVILQQFVRNEGSAWQYTLGSVDRYLDTILTSPSRMALFDTSAPASLLELAAGQAPELAKETIGFFLQSTELLGQRTAEMHLALASNHELPGFAPEPFTQLYQRSLYQSMRKLTLKTFGLFKKQLSHLPESTQALAQQVLARESEILQRFQSLIGHKIDAMRIRCHGDYHLGQVLFTGKDFVIIDFEGEPARTLSERKLKRSPLQDAAGMIRSLSYAASQGFFRQVHSGAFTPEQLPLLRTAANFWYRWSSSSFLKAYLEVAETGSFLPKQPQELELLLNNFLLEKAVYELAYELNNRPDWVEVPLYGILQLLD